MTTNTDNFETAGFIYDACADAAVVVPNGDLWDVHDDTADGPLVATVTTDVLNDLADNYDLPMKDADGWLWDGGAS